MNPSAQYQAGVLGSTLVFSPPLGTADAGASRAPSAGFTRAPSGGCTVLPGAPCGDFVMLVMVLAILLRMGSRLLLTALVSQRAA